MTSPKIQLVCFDLGRVLIDICDGFREAAGRSGCVAPLTLKEPTIRRAVQDLFIEHECGRVDDDGFARRVADAANWSPDAVLGMMRAWLKGPFPGVTDLIEELRERNGIQLACLSNTNGLHWSMMSAAAGDAALPLHRLHHRFASHFIGCMKPDARIYQHVEEATGIPPQGIVFFDDKAENCDGARQRGWSAHVIELDGDPVAQMRRHLTSHGVL
jgi:putative hydrolase of the HAD superfamily